MKPRGRVALRVSFGRIGMVYLERGELGECFLIVDALKWRRV